MTIYDDEDEAANEFPPTLSLSELLDKVFHVYELRDQETQFGLRHIAKIQLDGSDEEIEAWFNGVVLDRQTAKWHGDECANGHVHDCGDVLPGVRRLVKMGDKTNSPYRLSRPDDIEAQAATPVPKPEKAAAKVKVPPEPSPKYFANRNACLAFQSLHDQFRKAEGVVQAVNAACLTGAIPCRPIPHNDAEKPAATFTAWVGRERKRLKLSVDSLYGHILAAMRLAVEPPGFEEFEDETEEALPFE